MDSRNWAWGRAVPVNIRGDARATLERLSQIDGMPSKKYVLEFALLFLQRSISGVNEKRMIEHVLEYAMMRSLLEEIQGEQRTDDLRSKRSEIRGKRADKVFVDAPDPIVEFKRETDNFMKKNNQPSLTHNPFKDLKV